MTQAKSSNKGAIRMVLIIVSVFLIYSWYVGRQDRLEREAANPAIKCLSAWDGSHAGFVQATKEGMNDPESFEHVETRYIDRGEEVDLVMKFRGKNKFGGTVTQTVTGTILKDNCELVKGPTQLKI